jgi:hypothetical protein
LSSGCSPWMWSKMEITREYEYSLKAYKKPLSGAMHGLSINAKGCRSTISSTQIAAPGYCSKCWNHIGRSASWAHTSPGTAGLASPCDCVGYLKYNVAPQQLFDISSICLPSRDCSFPADGNLNITQASRCAMALSHTLNLLGTPLK